jgi:hypothetical protein
VTSAEQNKEKIREEREVGSTILANAKKDHINLMGH